MNFWKPDVRLGRASGFGQNMKDFSGFIKILKSNRYYYFWFIILLMAFTFFWSSWNVSKTEAYLGITARINSVAAHQLWQSQVFFLKPGELIGTIGEWLDSSVVNEKIKKETEAADGKSLKFVVKNKSPQFLGVFFIADNFSEAEKINSVLQKIIQQRLENLQTEDSPVIYDLIFDDLVLTKKEGDIAKRLVLAFMAGVLIIFFINLLFLLNYDYRR